MASSSKFNFNTTVHRGGKAIVGKNKIIIREGTSSTKNVADSEEEEKSVVNLLRREFYIRAPARKKVLASSSASRSTIAQETCDDPEDPDFFRELKRGFVVVLLNTRFSKITERIRSRWAENLRKFFEGQLKFEFRLYENLTAEEISEKAMDISEKDFKKYDSFFFVMISRGCEDLITGVKPEESVAVESITDRFTIDNCPSLENKPKFFIIQTHRNENRPKETLSKKDSCSSVSTKSFFSANEEKDFFIIQSNPSANVFSENETAVANGVAGGSCFIDTILRVFSAYHEKEHFQDLILRVNFILSKQKMEDPCLLPLPRVHNSLPPQKFVFTCN
eukprot:gene19536-21467_t